MYAPATPIETATPTPPNAAPRLAAPVSAVILEESSALTETLPAFIPAVSAPSIVLSPSIKALTSVEIVLTAPAPAPLTLTPTPPPETAAAPATTRASID